MGRHASLGAGFRQPGSRTHRPTPSSPPDPTASTLPPHPNPLHPPPNPTSQETPESMDYGPNAVWVGVLAQSNYCPPLLPALTSRPRNPLHPTPPRLASQETPESFDYPSAVRALATSGKAAAVVGAGLSGRCNPAEYNYNHFYGAAGPGSWQQVRRAGQDSLGKPGTGVVGGGLGGWVRGRVVWVWVSQRGPGMGMGWSGDAAAASVIAQAPLQPPPLPQRQASCSWPSAARCPGRPPPPPPALLARQVVKAAGHMQFVSSGNWLVDKALNLLCGAGRTTPEVRGAPGDCREGQEGAGRGRKGRGGEGQGGDHAQGEEARCRVCGRMMGGRGREGQGGRVRTAQPLRPRAVIICLPALGHWLRAAIAGAFSAERRSTRRSSLTHSLLPCQDRAGRLLLPACLPACRRCLAAWRRWLWDGCRPP